MKVYRIPKINKLPPQLAVPLEQAICEALQKHDDFLPDTYDQCVVESGATEIKSGDTIIVGRVYEPGTESADGREFRVLLMRDHHDQNWLVVPMIENLMTVTDL